MYLLNGWVDDTGIGGNIQQHPTEALRMLFIPKWDLVLCHLLNISHISTRFM